MALILRRYAGESIDINGKFLSVNEVTFYGGAVLNYCGKIKKCPPMQKIKIDNEIFITVYQNTDSNMVIDIAIDAPKHIKIMRSELL